MIAHIKSELRKLLTVRSTYAFLAICLAIVAFFAFYVQGYRLTEDITDAGKLANEFRSAGPAISIFIALVGVLLVTHEYRYNTIMYTLTSANNRLKVMLAKLLVVSLFAIVAGLFFSLLTVLLTYWGLQAKGLSMVPQNLPYGELIWQGAFYSWANAILAFILAFIIRNQIGAIVVLLVVPTTVESLLSLLLKDNVVYLPFTALGRVIGDSAMAIGSAISPERAALIVTGYIAGGLLIAALLFQKRDAN